MCKGNTVKAGTHTQFHDYVQKQIPTTRPTTKVIERVNGTNLTLIIKEEPYYWRPEPLPLKKLKTRPLVEKFDIKFPVTMEMVPSCRVMVYYVRKDKEVVADSVNVDVEDKLENQVTTVIMPVIVLSLTLSDYTDEYNFKNSGVKLYKCSTRGQKFAAPLPPPPHECQKHESDAVSEKFASSCLHV